MSTAGTMWERSLSIARSIASLRSTAHSGVDPRRCPCVGIGEGKGGEVVAIPFGLLWSRVDRLAQTSGSRLVSRLQTAAQMRPISHPGYLAGYGGRSLAASSASDSAAES